MTAPFSTVPVNRLFGFEQRQNATGAVEIAMHPSPDHLQEYGVVHGGIISALADTAAVYTIHPKLEPSDRMTSIEFKINFLAAATGTGGELVAVARLIRQGRTVAVVQSDVHQDGTHIATGLFTYAIRSGRRA